MRYMQKGGAGEMFCLPYAKPDRGVIAYGARCRAFVTMP